MVTQLRILATLVSLWAVLMGTLLSWPAYLKARQAARKAAVARDIYDLMGR